MKKPAAYILPAMILAFLLFFSTGCTNKQSLTTIDVIPSAESKIIINEVMSSNDIFLPDSDGRCHDWVELRNLTGQTYDLSSCYLTDDERDPFKFRLSGVSLQPHGYAVIYLSKQSRFDENGIPHANFKLSSDGETIYLNDSEGVVISSLCIPGSERNISFGFPEIASAYTDEYCVWFSSPTPGSQNSSEYSRSPSELKYSSNGVVINEYMTGNSITLRDGSGNYSDWVELYNPTDEDADMTGYMLSDDINSPGKWQFPKGTIIPSNGYLTIFCSGNNTPDERGQLHTDFSLSSDDASIILSSYQGAIVSSIEIHNIPENISCGYPTDSETEKLFARPTPNGANNTKTYELNTSPCPDINNGILISETLAASSAATEYPNDYIELFNSTSEDVDLNGYTLAQNPGETVFTFPEVTIKAGQYLLVWCDGTENTDGTSLHAPIKLNVGGEELYLADTSGQIVDQFLTGKQTQGITSGRVGNDASKRYFFAAPTPGAENSRSHYPAYAPQPQFSQQGGYVTGDLSVSISVPEGCTVHYTTNGSLPDRTSPVYDPSAPVKISRTTVLKAVAYKNDLLPSQVVSATYLAEEPHSLPVVSLSGAGLNDQENGILVSNSKYNVNRDVHIEYYDEKGILGIEFDAGAGIFGQTSRKLSKKGLSIDIRERYGISEITYPFFKQSVSGVTTFKSLLLRPSGQDQLTAMIRDELVPSIIRGKVEADYMEHQACALYVNGEYWGLYYIRDRFDEDYLVSKYGYEKGSIDLIKGQAKVQAGSIDAYDELEAFAQKNDLTKKENYEHIASLIDLESLCDFWIVETYFANTDSGNIRCYRAENGKWRWMIYDMDWAFFPTHAYYNFIWHHCLDPEGHGAIDFDNSIIRKLLENKDFRDLFISRYCYHINNTFEPDRCIAILDELSGSIRSEVSRNHEKWGQPKPENWENSIQFIRDFLRKKPEKAKEHLMTCFGLSERELEEYLRKNR